MIWIKHWDSKSDYTLLFFALRYTHTIDLRLYGRPPIIDRNDATNIGGLFEARCVVREWESIADKRVDQGNILHASKWKRDGRFSKLLNMWSTLQWRVSSTFWGGLAVSIRNCRISKWFQDSRFFKSSLKVFRNIIYAFGMCQTIQQPLSLSLWNRIWLGIQ